MYLKLKRLSRYVRAQVEEGAKVGVAGGKGEV